VASFGARLKQEREKQRISLDDVSLSTKIGTRLLQALEEEKFEQLPGGIFNKGFVRAYARHLGLDENQAVADYLQAAGQSPPPDPLAHVLQPGKAPMKLEESVAPAAKQAAPAIKQAAPAVKPAAPVTKTVKRIEAAAESHPLPVFSDVVAKREEDRPVPIPWGILAAFLFAVALVFGLWGYFKREREASAGRVHVATRTMAASDEGRGISPGPAASSFSKSQTTAPAGMRVPSVAGSDGKGGAAAPGSFILLIRANNDSWLLLSADGNKVFDDTLAGGSERSFSAQQEIVMKAGSIGDLEVSFNGNKLARQGEEGQVKTLTFGPQGIQPPSAKPPS